MEANRLWSESQILCENCGKGYLLLCPRPECVYTVTVESGTTSKYKGREGGDQTSPGNEILG